MCNIRQFYSTCKYFIFIINIWKGNILIHVQFCNCLSFYVANLKIGKMTFYSRNLIHCTIYIHLFDLSQSTNHHRYLICHNLQITTFNPKLVTVHNLCHFNPKLVTPTWYVERHSDQYSLNILQCIFRTLSIFCTYGYSMLLQFQYIVYILCIYYLTFFMTFCIHMHFT